MNERQMFARRLAEHLESMPVKRLAQGWHDGTCTCALGSMLGVDERAAGDMTVERAASMLGIPLALVDEVVSVNDEEMPGDQTDHATQTKLRFERVLAWAKTAADGDGYGAMC